MYARTAPAPWPPGDSETARRLRALDRDASPLGPPAAWPQSLRTAVDIMLASPGPVSVLWGPERVQLYNDAYIPIAGDRHPDGLGRPAAQVWPEAHDGFLGPILDRVLSGEAVTVTDRKVLLRGADGRDEERFFTASFSPIRDESDAVAGVFHPLTERTERQQLERLGRERADDLRAITDAVPMQIMTLDHEQRCRFANAEAGRVLGRSPEDLLGRTLGECLDARTYQRLKPRIEQALAGQEVGFEDRDPDRHGPGRHGWTEETLLPRLGPGGCVEEVVRVSRDITKRKDAEAALRANEERLGALAALVPALLWQIDRSGQDILLNPNWSTYTGQTPEESRNGGWLAAIHPEDRPRVARVFAEAYDKQEPLETEHRIRAADGSYRWFQVRQVPLRDGAGDAAQWFGAALDIHESRTAADALRASEERFRVLVSSIEDVFYVTDLEHGRLEYLSPRYEEIWARPVADMMDDPSGFLDSIHPEDHPAVRDAQDRQRRGEPVSAEYRIQRPDGETRWILDRSFPVPGHAQRRSAGVATDITARKTADEALRRSEERLSGIFASASVGLSEIGLDGMFLQVNEELCRILGRPRDEVLHLGVPDVTFPDDIPPSFEAVDRALAGEGSANLDKRYVRPDGRLVWANSRITRLRHGPGCADTLLVVTVDLTARRAAEAALRDSEHRFRQFGEASTDLLWIRDAGTLAFEYLSPAFETICGFRREKILGGNHVLRWAEIILPADRERVLDVVRRVRAGHSVAHTFRIRRRSDGEIRWLRSTDFPLFDQSGRVQRIAGIARDVTEEVETHDRLRVLVSELQHRTRNLVGVIRSVADRTLAGATSLEDFRARFRTRLDAIGRVNGLLSRLEEGDRITFDQLIRSELAAHGVVDGDGQGARVRLSGPEGIRLRSSTVQTFALALHELATNALKYGALSRPEGQLSVAWSVVGAREGSPLLHVDWRERGVAIDPSGAADDPPAPGRRGYGRELIERALPYQLRARTTYELGAGGVHCTIALPVSSSWEEDAVPAGAEP